jgi:hypothetical protein
MVESRDPYQSSSNQEPLIASSTNFAPMEALSNSPFTLLQSLILASVKGLAIPGTIIKLRNYAMFLTTMATFVSLFEVFRFSLKIGPLPSSDPQVLVWVLLCLAGSLTGTLGTFMLHKGMILAASLLFCCVLAPVTPNMIVIT